MPVRVARARFILRARGSQKRQSAIIIVTRFDHLVIGRPVAEGRRRHLPALIRRLDARWAWAAIRAFLPCGRAAL